ENLPSISYLLKAVHGGAKPTYSRLEPEDSQNGLDHVIDDDRIFYGAENGEEANGVHG
ncbi:MAG: hypothetical protein JWP08_3984, partial [Bryobacterales bacterium]|nr:hypothetical protein [Bryobacterales bacterium]